MSSGFEFAFVHQDQVLARFTLQHGDYFIGRGSGCRIDIDIDGISPRHARLTVGARLIYEDLSSEAGSFHEGRRLSEPFEMQTGTAIQLGDAGALRLESRPAPVPAPPVAPECKAETASQLPDAKAAEEPRRVAEKEQPRVETGSGPEPLHATIAVLEASVARQQAARVEIQRLRKALVLEMDVRRHMEERLAAVARERTAALLLSTPKAGASVRMRAKWHVAAVALVAIALTCGGIARWARHRTEEARVAASSIGTLRPAAEQFVAAAEDCVERGDWTGGMQQLRYALTLVPEHAGWRCRLGDLSMVQFDFQNALAAYREAAARDPGMADAGEGVTVCERLVRAKESPAAPSASARYAVHRAMMKHGHLAEAVWIAATLAEDADLQQQTWQARLKEGGLDADVRLDAARRLTVRLRGQVQSRLGLLRGMRAVALWMPETDVTDLQPLAGLPIEELDLSRTMVAHVSPLRDMPLHRLNLDRTQVEDIFPLRRLPLEELHAARTPLRSISALRDMPLRTLDISHTRVADLQALRTVALQELDASSTPVADLSPLSHLPLVKVRLDDTRVTDLSPLRGTLLTELSVARTPITSIEALSKSSIAILSLSGCSELRDLQLVSSLPDLQNLIPPTKILPPSILAAIPKVRFID